MTVSYYETGRDWLTGNYKWLLIVSCIPLFSTKALFNLPLIIMAILGAVSLFRNTQAVRTDTSIRVMGVLFLSIWLPLLFSLPDAVEPGRSVSTVVRYLALPLVGIFIIQSCRSQYVRLRVYFGVVILIVAICLDALTQYVLGYNLLGNPMMHGRVTGIFYPKLHIGLLLAVLSPVVFEFTLDYVKRTRMVLLLPLLLMTVILLAGNRVSWLMFMMVVFVYLIYTYTRMNMNLTWRSMLAVVAIVSIALFMAYKSPIVHSRINKTAGVFSTDFHAVDVATAYRLSIWKVGWDVYKANPVNGIGPRGFRYVFTTYADKDNYWSTLDGRGVTHPHLMILEVAVETGTIGLIGYLLFFVFLIRYYWQCDRSRRMSMFPWLISVLVAVFPLNAHMAWYASYWGAVSWWLLVIALGMTNRRGVSKCVL